MSDSDEEDGKPSTFVLKKEPPSSDEEDAGGGFMGFAIYAESTSSESEDDEGIIEPVDKVEEAKKVSMAEILASRTTSKLGSQEPEPDTDTDDEIDFTGFLADAPSWMFESPSEESEDEEDNYPPHQRGPMAMGTTRPEQYILKINEKIDIFNKSYNVKRKNSKLINLLKKYDFELDNIDIVNYDEGKGPQPVTLHTFTQDKRIEDSGPMSRPEAERFIAELQKFMIKDNPDLLGIHLHTDHYTPAKLLDEMMVWTYVDKDDVDFPGNIT